MVVRTRIVVARIRFRTAGVIADRIHMVSVAVYALARRVVAVGAAAVVGIPVVGTCAVIRILALIILAGKGRAHMAVVGGTRVVIIVGVIIPGVIAVVVIAAAGNGAGGQQDRGGEHEQELHDGHHHAERGSKARPAKP